MTLARDLTVVIKTFDRPNLLRHLLRTLRQSYPDLPVVVVDDGRRPFEPRHADRHTRLIRTEFDIGLSAGRNRGVAEVDTPYTFILDDDFAFTSESDLARLLGPVAAGDFAICGSRMLNFGSMEICYHGIFEHGNGRLRLLHGNNRGVRDGWPVLDYCHNIFCARTELLRQHGWDERLKVHEHWEFFLRLQRTIGADVTIAADTGFAHFPIRNRNYKRFRNLRDHFEDLALQLSGLQSIDIVGTTPKPKGLAKWRYSVLKRAMGAYFSLPG